MKLDDIKKEIRMDLQIRRKVWRKIPGSDQFLDIEHQRRYDLLEKLHHVLDSITPIEWFRFVGRVEKKRKTENSIMTLF